MAGSASLYGCTDCSRWRAALGCYGDVVKLLANEKRKRKGGKIKPKVETEGLVQLDTWFQETLPEVVASRGSPHLKHDELAKLMRWKLTRGKFRPRLTELVQQNSPSEVEASTHAALAALPNLKEAIKLLSSRLKGVGPATASAILCVLSPTKGVPFMADESVQAVPGLKLDYTLRHYLLYAAQIQGKAKELSAQDKSGKRWTAHEVELALWSHHFATKLQPGLLTSVPTSDHTPSQGTRREASSDSNSSDDEPPKKRHKHS